MAILGPSGCGKTTLLRILAGLLTSKSSTGKLEGSVTIDAVSPSEYRRRARIGFMFQEPTLLPHLTVRQNIELPLKLLGMKDMSPALELMERVGLTTFADYMPKNLSGGMKSRVALARSFITHPTLLLLDEPFVSLDVGWKADLTAQVQLLRESTESTMFLVTHDVREAMQLATSVLVLNAHGQVIMLERISGTSSEDSLYNSILDGILRGHPAERVQNDGIRSKAQ
jgi:NitT/TauT family transport system ATP-binding protein